MRRALWADDESSRSCTKCRVEFNYMVFKHHCRKCGLIYCNECSRNKLLIPGDEMVIRPSDWMAQVAQSLPDTVVNDEDNFRCPQRVCDGCAHQLRPLQEDLRLLVSRANMDTPIHTKYITGVPQIDYYLENEIRNATLTLYNLRNTQGEENIPRELLDIAKGVVFLTIVKVGFMFTGRYGSGLVVAKLPDGSWSAPSAISITGMGWGLQIGAEITDVMLILSSDAAVDTFKSRAQVSVGAELGVSVGPIGRALASDVTAGNKGAAHAFSYAHSKGLFFGASLEASAIAARPDVNRKFYGQKISPSVLLSGEYPRPRGAQPLYDALNEILGGPAYTTSIPPTPPPAPYGGSGGSTSQRSAGAGGAVQPPQAPADSYAYSYGAASAPSFSSPTNAYNAGGVNNSGGGGYASASNVYSTGGTGYAPATNDYSTGGASSGYPPSSSAVNGSAYSNSGSSNGSAPVTRRGEDMVL